MVCSKCSFKRLPRGRAVDKVKNLSEEHKQKIGLANRGKLSGLTEEKSRRWRGDKVGYRALHYWVRRQKGIAEICEFCGFTRTSAKNVQWANKSHKYKRKLEDWIALCVPCHKKYDQV